MEERKMIAYKGFNGDMTCRDFQYEVGKGYIYEGDIELCESGFHACRNPFDVLNYYNNMLNDKYCVVEQSGTIKEGRDKQVSSKISIKEEIGWQGLIKAGIDYIKDLTKPVGISNDMSNDDDYSAQIDSSGDYAKIGPSGDYAKISSSGDYAKIGSSGYSAQIGSSGYYAHIGSSGDDAQIGLSGDRARIGLSGDYARIGSSGDYARIDSCGDFVSIVSSGDYDQIGSSGLDSVIMCAGNRSTVCAKKGSWITLSEWEDDKEKGRLVPKYVKAEYVDGERIKEDVWYRLVNGEFKEVKNY